MSILPVPIVRHAQLPYSRGQRVTIEAWFCTDPTALREEALEGATTIKLYSVTNMAPSGLLRISGGHDQLAETVTIASVATATRTVTLSAPGLLFSHYLDPDDWLTDHVAILGNPTTPALQYLKPGDTVPRTDVSLTPVSTGYYTATLLLDVSGKWKYRVIDSATGIEKANWRTFDVRRDDF
jgi:hypothetical protein